ncbi:gliding motility protein GldN [Pedobacter riviphilus]|uniref:Gliding motility protein GldN n=1 Tax=Pedobacter riviphilus TaxID=2766984 RepID=A0ABX6TH64_9SPHI|nr:MULTISPECIES: gliding motility protein GldN [Pedobacter]NII85834.1 gliding motility associated protein GldN [Pedobacter sp. SG908]NMN39252.1 gliding motility associated protein GldN [Pedobacter sp. SG918]QNR83735.1 gliding motility protein GldN [Pedobacter riviphilus]
MKRILSIAILVLLTTFAFAQKKPTKLAPKKAAPVVAAPPVADTVKAPVKTAKKKLKVPPKDGFYARKDIDSTEMVPLADVREEDVFYAKRIWREIDLRDTVNSVLKSPKSRLIDVLIAAIKKDELTAYSPIDSALNEDDAFLNPMSADSASKSALGTAEVSNNKTGTVTTVVNDFNPELFLKFRIKEDWIFDTKRSVFEPRIVGIAPLKYNEVSKQWQPVFWVYYPEAREILTKKRLINTNNDASSLSFDDFFIRRLFSSYIVKESNPGDNKIRDIITDPRERLYESERIKKSVLDYEQGLWEY